MRSKRKELLKRNLELAKALLLRILKNPKLLETLPNETTLLLCPVPLSQEKVAENLEP